MNLGNDRAALIAAFLGLAAAAAVPAAAHAQDDRAAAQGAAPDRSDRSSAEGEAARGSSPAAARDPSGRAVTPGSFDRTAADDDPERAAVAFVVGNIEFLLLHEIAHLLISEKEIPIIGPEENAADYIATLALIREEPLDPNVPGRGVRFLLSAADAFFASWQTGITLGADVPYWGSHALGIQRYYQIACLLYGSDPDVFTRVREVAELPEERAQSCVGEYENADRAIQWLLDNFGRAAGDPEGAATEILYERPPTMVSTRVLRELQALELLERTLERLRVRFAFDRPFTLAMRACGQAEAAWIPDRRELLICYDLLDRLYLLGLQTGRER